MHEFTFACSITAEASPEEEESGVHGLLGRLRHPMVLYGQLIHEMENSLLPIFPSGMGVKPPILITPLSCIQSGGMLVA